MGANKEPEAIRCDDGNDMRELGDEEEIDSLELTFNWQPKPELSHRV